MSIRLEQVSVKVGKATPITLLHDINGTIEDGKITLIIGKTSSGKTTLLEAISGLSPISSGAIRYDHQPLWVGKRVNSALRLLTGNVFQYPEHQLFARTVKGEFEYSLKPYRLPKKTIDERTQSSLQAVQLDQALLHQSPLILSGGQKRRVSLASTFSTHPEWLFLDEPSAGLDPIALQHLIAMILEWKQQSRGGIVIATHDLDAFLPIADMVLILKNGRLFASTTPNELLSRMDLLRYAEIGLPTSAEVARLFHDKGIAIPPGWLSPEQMAMAIARQEPLALKNDPEECTPLAPLKMTKGHISEGKRPRSSLAKYIIDLDPRAKWVMYLLFSIGILVQPTWIGLFYATMVSALVVGLSQVPIRDLRRFIMPFFVFIVMSVGFSGITLIYHTHHFAGIGFSLQNGMHTGKQMFRILLIMVLGLWLPLTTTHLKIKKGIEQSLTRIPGMATVAEAVALSASLTMRFIPLMLRETDRFSKVARARGKSHANPGSIRLQDIRAIMTPLLLAVFQLADNLSTAMEVRGYHRLGLKRTASTQLKMTHKDTAGLIIGALLILMIFFIR